MYLFVASPPRRVTVASLMNRKWIFNSLAALDDILLLAVSLIDELRVRLLPVYFEPR